MDTVGHRWTPLDTVGCIDWTDTQKSFFLVDGHSSRFQPDFFKYIIDHAQEWVVVLARAKEELISKKTKDDDATYN